MKEIKNMPPLTEEQKQRIKEIYNKYKEEQKEQKNKIYHCKKCGKEITYNEKDDCKGYCYKHSKR